MPTVDPQTLRRRAAFGDAVRRLRQERGWTQEELAHRTGFDRKSVNRIENASYSPAVDRLFPLADALGVAVSALFADDPGAGARRGKRT